MSGRVFWAEMDSASAVAELTRTGPHYQGDSKILLEEAMSCALRNCAQWHRNEGPLDALAWAVLPLRFERLEALNVSSPEPGDFSIDCLDEGGGLEKSVYHLLEANFPGAVYLNPQFDDRLGRRELADLLIVTDTDLLIIESKVMAMLERNPLQKTKRRVTNVFSQFQKGISQLKGSVKTLRLGRMVFTKQGVPIETEPEKEKAIHGIVLLSTTNLCLPWPEIGAELVSASGKSGAKFHMLDLIEFQQHVAFGKSLGRLFAYLNKRFEVVSSGNANAKTYFLNEENQGVSSSPIEDEAVGYLFLFAVNGNAEIDGGSILTVFQKPLKADGFTGRFEYFQDIGLIDDKTVFAVAIGIQWKREWENYPSYDWWSAYAEKVRADLETNPNLTVSSLSKAVMLGKIRASQTLVLVTEFVDGKAVGFLNPDETAEK